MTVTHAVQRTKPIPKNDYFADEFIFTLEILTIYGKCNV
jgi:hypothetical protein